MTRYNPNRHNRQSIRLKGYDYTRPGAYFVTIVTHERAPVFGDPVFRRVAETMWQRIPRHFTDVELDAWVVMPNHMHGIIVIVEEPYPCGPPSGSLGAIVGNFKSVTTRRINRIRKTPGARLWQRNYHDRVIRDKRGLIAVRRYIQENPLRWSNDRNNPERG